MKFVGFFNLELDPDYVFNHKININNKLIKLYLHKDLRYIIIDIITPYEERYFCDLKSINDYWSFQERLSEDETFFVKEQMLKIHNKFKNMQVFQ